MPLEIEYILQFIERGETEWSSLRRYTTESEAREALSSWRAWHPDIPSRLMWRNLELKELAE